MIKKSITFVIFTILIQMNHARMVSDVRERMVPSLRLDQTDIRDALNLFFKSVNVPYAVNEDVQGNVTLVIENQPFETVLRSILNQVGATYKQNQGNYEIFLRKTDQASSAMPSNFGGAANNQMEQAGNKMEPIIRRIRIDYADPQLVWTLLNQPGANFKLHPEITTIAQDGDVGGGFKSGFGGSSSLGKQGFGNFIK